MNVLHKNVFLFKFEFLILKMKNLDNKSTVGAYKFSILLLKKQYRITETISSNQFR